MSEWIRVTDRLPEDDGNFVLAVCYGNPERNVTLYGAAMMAVYDPQEGWILDDYPEWEGVTVTYWMPIPDIPKDSDYAAKILSASPDAWREMDKEGKRSV